MTTEPRPTGRHQAGSLVWERTFRAPIADVWSAITEPERLDRWIGTWSGDPTDGFVMFDMTAEGEGDPSRFEIRACDEPRLLQVSSVDEHGTWNLTLTLSEDAGVTTLVFAQEITDVDAVEHTGPGWDYYLDRLVAAETGADVAAVDWDAYWPAQQSFYAGIADSLR